MAVGAGLQSTVALINLCCFYLIGIPIGALLWYAAHLQVKVNDAFLIETFLIAWNTVDHYVVILDSSKTVSVDVTAA